MRTPCVYGTHSRYDDAKLYAIATFHIENNGYKKYAMSESEKDNFAKQRGVCINNLESGKVLFFIFL